MVNEIELLRSFARVKQDIEKLNYQINDLVSRQQRIIAYLNSTVEESKKFIATIKGKKVHVENCPVAKRIINKNKISFDNKSDALSHGFVPCACMEE